VAAQLVACRLAPSSTELVKWRVQLQRIGTLLAASSVHRLVYILVLLHCGNACALYLSFLYHDGKRQAFCYGGHNCRLAPSASIKPLSPHGGTREHALEALFN
jgi:hypothetical protein